MLVERRGIAAEIYQQFADEAAALGPEEQG